MGTDYLDDPTPKRLMHSGRMHNTWHSRDYAPFIPCKVICCPCNKNDKCELPSNIKINAAGSCQTGLDFLADERKNLLEKVAKLDKTLDSNKTHIKSKCK